jgi:hypothetical protein
MNDFGNHSWRLGCLNETRGFPDPPRGEGGFFIENSVLIAASIFFLDCPAYHAICLCIRLHDKGLDPEKPSPPEAKNAKVVRIVLRAHMCFR